MTALVARTDETALLGYLVFEIIERDKSVLKSAKRTGFLYQIVVDEFHRQCGIGSHLVDPMKDRLRQEGISQLQSEHYSFNAASAAFMRSIGLMPVSVTVEGLL